MVARTSASWPRIARARVFCGNVLGAGQQELCRSFAMSGGNEFAGAEWDPAQATGSPLLRGVPAWIDCAIHAVRTGGDHLVVIGRIRGLSCRGGH